MEEKQEIMTLEDFQRILCFNLKKKKYRRRF